jgi:hypothetical protein
VSCPTGASAKMATAVKMCNENGLSRPNLAFQFN